MVEIGCFLHVQVGERGWEGDKRMVEAEQFYEQVGKRGRKQVERVIKI